MTNVWQLSAALTDPLADAVQLLLQVRALPVARREADHPGQLIPPGGPSLALDDSAAILNALPAQDAPGSDAPPDTRLRIAAGVIRALKRLDELDPNAFPADLDLVIYALRQELRPLDALAAGAVAAQSGSEPRDTALLLAPLLWRLGLLDRHFHLFLLSGLPGLAALHVRLLTQPPVAAFFDADKARRFLAGLKRSHPDRPGPTDWSRALGAGGQEKSLLSSGQRRKFPSIGSNGHIR